MPCHQSVSPVCDKVSFIKMSDINIQALDMGKLIENLQLQLEELETLNSMFCNPGEIRVEDLGVLADIEDYVSGKTKVIPLCLDLTVNLVIENQKFEVCVTLPHEYPDTKPEIFVRNHTLNREQHKKLNKDLIKSFDTLQPCVFSAISWLQDNALNYITAVKPENEKITDKKSESLLRHWIYSHHIYSKTKRREIQDLANALHITGFCMPGKPGIICIEGFQSDINEWWQSIKSMNWKRIFIKITEECNENPDSFLKFDSFKEMVFQNNSIKNTHMDMGGLHKFLDEHQCGDVFKDLFGVEAKSGS